MTRLGKMLSLFWNPKPIGPPWEQLTKKDIRKYLAEGGGQLEGRISAASDFIVSSDM